MMTLCGQAFSGAFFSLRGSSLDVRGCHAGGAGRAVAHGVSQPSSTRAGPSHG